MFYYLNNFLFFSVFGYFFETTIFTILKLQNESGFMHLWWTPFYGSGVLITLAVYHFLTKKIPNKTKKNIIMFITLFIVLTLLEQVGGILMEWLHGYSLWSYKSIPLNIGKYISVPTSLGWVLFSFFYIYVIKKYTDKLLSKVPKSLTIILTLTFIADFLLTTIHLLYLKTL